MQYRVQGIVIRSMDYGEGNKIITLFTREHGKLSVVARGAKKVKSRYGSSAQLFTCGDYLFFKSGQLGTLNHAEIIEPFHKIREDLHKAAHASYLSELTDRMLGDQEGQPFLYDQLKASLQAIQEDKDLQIIDHLYEMKMFVLAGYTPELEQCVVCREKAEPFAISIGMGGMLCERCKLRDPQAIPLTPGVYKLLRLFIQTDVRRLGQIDVKPQTKQLLKTILRAYFDTHVGLKLKSRDFLDQMDKYGV
ncbi:DNA replication and repair protein RecO [Paenibacillus tianmuensis]|uniref:DNA repair protein RecO n=1 Tax=Paenibacillus tianmuensis TaxID=624147 RepID=A0A1G4QV28_9BACL|nr:DNA repair protein RecO [Paenibacillus tianmuensis]SCW48466.1 DNA replication and repair protein RecO [Paenibacillus tianmuensis]